MVYFKKDSKSTGFRLMANVHMYYTYLTAYEISVPFNRNRGSVTVVLLYLKVTGTYFGIILASLT